MNPAPHWRIVLIALLLALTIGSAGQISPVQAAPAGDTEIEFIFESLKTLKPVCVGDKKEINVYLHRRLQPSDPKFTTGLGGSKQAVPGISIKAAMADGPIIRKISPTQNTTNNLSGGAQFIFLAENPGESAITFEATVTRGWFGTNWGSDTISGIIYHPIKVINCEFKVTTIQQAIVAGGGNFNIVAMLDEVEITRDEQGHFAGTTPVNWVGAASNVGICSASINIAPTTQANLTADMDENGQLTGTLTIEAPQTTVTATCVGISNTATMSLSADPLEFSVPSSGGVVKVAQGFVFETANMPGSAVIVVVPVEDEAVVFNAGSRAAPLSPSLWWAMLWDNFPWSYSVLFALR